MLCLSPVWKVCCALYGMQLIDAYVSRVSSPRVRYIVLRAGRSVVCASLGSLPMTLTLLCCNCFPYMYVLLCECTCVTCFVSSVILNWRTSDTVL